MKLAKKTITVPTKSTPFRIYFISCLHKGTRAHDRNSLKRWVKAIRDDPQGYAIVLGDLCECILPSDKRFDITMVHPDLLEHVSLNRTSDIISWQVKQTIEDLSPLKGKIIAVHRGTHEDLIFRHYNRDISPVIAEALEAEYWEWRCFSRIRVRCASSDHSSIVLPMLTFHGSKAGQTDAAVRNMIHRQMEYWDARIIICGHSHRVTPIKEPYMKITTKGPLKHLQLIRVGGSTGSFYRAYGEGTSYAERRDVSPTLLGCLYISYKLQTDDLNIHS